MLLHRVFFCLKRNIIEISNKIVYNKKAEENMFEKLYMFSQTRFHSVPANVSKRYNDSEKLELTEQFKVNIFVFEAIARAGRERDRENKYIYFNKKRNKMQN